MRFKYLDSLTLSDPAAISNGIVMDADNIYVSDEGGANGSIYKISKSSFTETSKAAITAHMPLGVAEYSDYVYVIGSIAVSPWSAKVCKIQKSDLVETDSITLNGADWKQRCWNGALLIIGDYLYGSCEGGIVKIQISTFTLTTFLDLATPSGSDHFDRCFRMATDGTYLYVGDLYDSVHRIRLSTFAYVDSIATFPDTTRACYVDGDYIYVGVDDTPGKIYRVQLSTFTIVDNIAFKATVPQDIGCNDVIVIGDYIYGNVRSGPNKLYEVDTATFSDIKKTSSGGYLLQLANSGNKIYATSYEEIIYRYSIPILGVQII